MQPITSSITNITGTSGNVRKSREDCYIYIHNVGLLTFNTRNIIGHQVASLLAVTEDIGDILGERQTSAVWIIASDNRVLSSQSCVTQDVFTCTLHQIGYSHQHRGSGRPPQHQCDCHCWNFVIAKKGVNL